MPWSVWVYCLIVFWLFFVCNFMTDWVFKMAKVKQPAKKESVHHPIKTHLKILKTVSYHPPGGWNPNIFDILWCPISVTLSWGFMNCRTCCNIQVHCIDHLSLPCDSDASDSSFGCLACAAKGRTSTAMEILVGEWFSRASEWHSESRFKMRIPKIDGLKLTCEIQWNMSYYSYQHSWWRISSINHFGCHIMSDGNKALASKENMVGYHLSL